jgi:hypothetical protein
VLLRVTLCKLIFYCYTEVHRGYTKSHREE